MASLLAGKIAPIDHGDGAGMNLMNIQKKAWHPEALVATAPDLRKKLPRLAESWHFVGRISPYFVKKYGMNPRAQTIACVSHAGVNATLPSDLTPEAVTLDRAIELLDARAAKMGERSDQAPRAGQACQIGGETGRKTRRQRRREACWQASRQPAAKPVVGKPKGAKKAPAHKPVARKAPSRVAAAPAKPANKKSARKKAAE